MALDWSGFSSTGWYSSPAPSLGGSAVRPAWLSWWEFYPSASYSTMGLVGLYNPNGAGSQFSRTGYRRNNATSLLIADSDDAGGVNGQFSPSYTPIVGAWFHNVIQLDSLSKRRYFMAGSLIGTGTGTGAATNHTLLQIGSPSIDTGNFAGMQVAEVVYGTGTLSQAQITALAGGANPLAVVPQQQIFGYYPLRGDLSDLSQARAGLTIGGGTVGRKWVAHPTVDLPPRRRLFRSPPTQARPRRPFVFFDYAA